MLFALDNNKNRVHINEADRELRDDPNHKVYCLIKFVRNYKIHEVNKSDFFRNNYLSPMAYRVRIRVAE